MTRRPNPRVLQGECERFNRLHPAGTEVRVWTGLMHDGPGTVGRVAEPGAYVMSGHTPVVHVSGVRGCIALTHVEPVA